VPAYDFKSTIEHGLKSLQSYAAVREDFILGPGRYLILSDIHIPYHDLKALQIALEYGRANGIENVLLNGDIIDCHQLSRYETSPDARSFAQELHTLRMFLALLRQNFGGWIGYKVGNHEHRLSMYLMSKAPELFDMPELGFGSLAHLEEFDIDLIESKQIVKAGRLNIIHGHEFGKSNFSPVNPARGAFIRTKCSTMAGHNHQTSEHHESNLNGDAMACWSTGCLCEMSPAYMPLAYLRWNHGFAVVEVEQGGSFTVENKRIIGDKVH
jgi:predicted phosphodiesterase